MSTSAISYFVINLERSPERKAYILSQAQAMGIDLQVVTAVEGQALTDEQRASYDADRLHTYKNYNLLDNEIACTLSHRKALGVFLESKAEFAVVLEDDNDLLPLFERGVRELAEQLRGWDVAKLYLGSGIRAMPLWRQKPGLAIRPIYHRKFGSGSMGYMYTRRAAEVLYKELACVWLPADSQIYQIVLEKQLRIIGVQPDLVCAAGFSSTISTAGTPNRRDVGKRSLKQYVRYRLFLYANMIRKILLLLKVLLHLRRVA